MVKLYELRITNAAGEIVDKAFSTDKEDLSFLKGFRQEQDKANNMQADIIEHSSEQ